jgi:hypothetical protein
MKKPRAVLATSAVFLSAALVASYFQFQQPTIKATEVLTWDCESAVYKPESITLTCADGGILLQDIDWKEWGSEGARGSGVYSENNCQPDCSRGEFSETRVEILLKPFRGSKSGLYLENLVIKPLTGQTLPKNQIQIDVDLSEFSGVISND